MNNEINIIKDEFISIWQKEIKELFRLGYLVYESQIQAEFYFLLRKKLEDKLKNLRIWSDPKIYNNQNPSKLKLIPDMVINVDKTALLILDR